MPHPPSCQIDINKHIKTWNKKFRTAPQCKRPRPLSAFETDWNLHCLDPTAASVVVRRDMVWEVYSKERLLFICTQWTDEAPYIVSPDNNRLPHGPGRDTIHKQIIDYHNVQTLQYHPLEQTVNKRGRHHVNPSWATAPITRLETLYLYSSRQHSGRIHAQNFSTLQGPYYLPYRIDMYIIISIFLFWCCV